MSPDGKSVASSRLNPQSGMMDIYLYDLVSGKNSRFTYNSQNNFQPVWSPDNDAIVFYSSPGGSSTVYEKRRGPQATTRFWTRARALEVRRIGRGMIATSLNKLSATPNRVTTSGSCPFCRNGRAATKSRFPICKPTPTKLRQGYRLTGNGWRTSRMRPREMRSTSRRFHCPEGNRKFRPTAEAPEWSRDGKELFSSPRTAK